MESSRDANLQAAIAYCEYIYRRYGRFPAYAPPMKTVLGFQVNHLDVSSMIVSIGPRL